MTKVSEYDYRVDPDDPKRVVMRATSGNWCSILDTTIYTPDQVAHWTRLMPVPEYRPEFRARRYDPQPVFAVTADGMFLCSNHDRGLKPGWACPNCRDLNGNPIGQEKNCGLAHDPEQISCQDAELSRNRPMQAHPTLPTEVPVEGRQRRSEAAAKTTQVTSNHRITPSDVLRNALLSGKSLLCTLGDHTECILSARSCTCSCHDRTAENEQ
jgi:hypothetical protein